MSPKSSALLLFLLVLAAIAAAALPASSQQGPAPRSGELQPGKILAVQPHEEGRAFDWVTRSAIPIYDHYPFYDLTIRSGDKTYVVRYESQTGYYPSAWKPGSTIQVRPEHGRLYLVRYDGTEVPAGILSGGRGPDRGPGRDHHPGRDHASRGRAVLLGDSDCRSDRD